MTKGSLLVCASLFVLGFVTPAAAADLTARPYVKAPMMEQVYDWSGFYVGINGGGGWSRIGDNDDGNIKTNGGTVGGQIGYRWQASNWVFGVEGQGNWADFTKNWVQNWNDDDNTVQRDKFRTDSFALITGQVGYAWNNVLLYVKGGAAVINNKLDSVAKGDTLSQSISASETRWGGAVGVGLDYGFAPNWSIGIEWDHAFFSGRDLNFTQVDTDKTVTSGTGRLGRQNIDMALVRLNYKFGGPVAARY